MRDVLDGASETAHREPQRIVVALYSNELLIENSAAKSPDRSRTLVDSSMVLAVVDGEYRQMLPAATPQAGLAPSRELGTRYASPHQA
ncbi:hypothetical protein ACVWXM_001535 [Bradyrhizobium sp. GM7.3]